MSRSCSSAVSPRSRSAVESRCNSARPSAYRAWPSVKSSADRSAICTASSMSSSAALSASSAPTHIPDPYVKAMTIAWVVGSISRDMAAATGRAGSTSASVRPMDAPPSARIAWANASGDPMMKLPLVGSPSASSMTLCDQRATTACSPVRLGARQRHRVDQRGQPPPPRRRVDRRQLGIRGTNAQQVIQQHQILRVQTVGHPVAQPRPRGRII